MLGVESPNTENVANSAPYGDWLNFLYQDAVHLVAEPDCCRVVCSTSCEILQRVPAATEAIRRIGSTEPAALLYDAMEGNLFASFY